MNNKKIVLMITQHLHAGGIETSILNICRNIDKQAYEIELFCCEDSRYMAFEDKFSEYAIHKASNIDSVCGKLSFLRQLYNLLRTNRYDIVHSNMGMFDCVTLWLAQSCGVRTRVSHGHFNDSPYAKNSIKKILVRMVRSATKKIIRSCATDCIACSDEANNYCFDGRGSVIFNGIDFEIFASQKGKSVSDEKIHLITVGRIAYAKNPLFIVDVVNELSKIRQDIILTWVGVGRLDEVKTKINYLGLENHFVFLGARYDIPELMRENQFFILPSLIEGLPIALIEAQACGCDCFASNNVPSTANCGKVMFLPIDDARVWADAINEHIKEPMWSVDQNAIGRFNIRNTIKQIEEIYSQ